ncbi:MAG: CAP domain-containing protein [Acidobacteria bacterium]|nr:CAP domain-containing protein [Acidobacteriota bacterium]
MIISRFRRTRCFFAPLLGLILASGAIAGPPAAYDEFDYESLTIGQFKEYAPANAIIDFSRVDYGLLHAAIFFETNRMRRLYELKELRHWTALEKAAFRHSQDMVEQGFYSHIHPTDEKKQFPAQRIFLAGAPLGSTAENIASTFGIRYRSGEHVRPPRERTEPFVDPATNAPIPPHTYNSLAESVVGGWMTSPQHRENILHKNFHFMGCGAYFYRDEQFHGMPLFRVTQTFWGPPHIRNQEIRRPADIQSGRF